MKMPRIFGFFLLVRLASVWLVQTWYVPDEYWQSLEVAHNLAFGYGHMTWEWLLGIRSYLLPLLIAGIYKLLEYLSLDTVQLLIYLPRIGQAILSAYADLKFYRWSGNKKWAAFNISIAHFLFYTGSRTLINTFETSLTTIALSMFPWPGKNRGSYKFLWIVGLLFFVRPTSAVVWLPLCIYHLATSSSLWVTIFKQYLPIGLTTFLVTVGVDSFCHGSLLITPWEFLKANVLNGVGSFYGTHPWFWYLSTGLPSVLGVHFLLFFASALHILRSRQYQITNLILLTTVVFTVFIYSWLPHKEFRFILPTIPIILYLISDTVSRWSYTANGTLVWLLAGVLLMGNSVPAWYLGMVHQRGTIDVMRPLAEIAQKNPQSTSFLFLMPCHSTPLYSHLHVNVSTRFLTCEPNIYNTKDYTDEMTDFYKTPDQWLRKHYPPNGTLPSHIITFDNVEPRISSILSRYKLLLTLFHSYLPVDRGGKYVIVHELKF